MTKRCDEVGCDCVAKFGTKCKYHTCRCSDPIGPGQIHGGCYVHGVKF